MKKLLLFSLFCLSLCFAAIGQSSLNLTAEQEHTYMGFLKNRFFFKGFAAFYHPGKFYDDISLYLVHANEQDSIGLSKVIAEIQPLIPNKISYAPNKATANFVIELLDSMGQVAEYKKQQSEVGNKNGYQRNWIKSQHYMVLIADSISQSQRDKIIRFYCVRGLVIAERRMFYDNPRRSNTEGVSIFNPVRFLKDGEHQAYVDFTPKDKFFLAKLYSPDLDEQIGRYAYKEYGLWYYLNFTIADKVALYAMKTLVLVLFILMVTALSFNLVISKRYKKHYWSYFCNAILIMASVLGAFMLSEAMPVYDSLKLNFNYSSIDIVESIIFVVVFFAYAGISASVLYVLEQYLIKSKWTLFFRLFLKVCYCIIAFAIPFMIIQINGYSVFSPSNRSVAVFACCLLVGLSFVRGVFLYFKERGDAMLRQKDVELSKLKELKAEAEVASLHARINPHFLYNSLNSIAGLAHSNPDKTERMALSLSDLFRHNINRKNEMDTTLNEEIEAVKAYLEIEQIRFGDRMEFSVDVENGLEETRIPRNIIQPLVENAIKHGVSNIPGKGILVLSVKKSDGGIIISVSDNGPDFPDGLQSGYGLQSIFDILKFSYGQEAEINQENHPEKRIWIHISEKGLKQHLKNDEPAV